MTFIDQGVETNKSAITVENTIPINAYIYTSNNNLIGGEMTSPAEWIKMPHYQGNIGINTTLQIRPGRVRKMGEHTVVTSGEDKLIILVDPVTITHTLTN